MIGWPKWCHYGVVFGRLRSKIGVCRNGCQEHRFNLKIEPIGLGQNIKIVNGAIDFPSLILFLKISENGENKKIFPNLVKFSFSFEREREYL